MRIDRTRASWQNHHCIDKIEEHFFYKKLSGQNSCTYRDLNKLNFGKPLETRLSPSLRSVPLIVPHPEEAKGASASGAGGSAAGSLGGSEAEARRKAQRRRRRLKAKEMERKKKEEEEGRGGEGGPSEFEKKKKNPVGRPPKKPRNPGAETKDPRLPKRPQNPFFQFCQEQRARVQRDFLREHGEEAQLSKKELTKMLAQGRISDGGGCFAKTLVAVGPD